MKKIISILLTLLVVCNAAVFSFGTTPEPVLSGEAGILIDMTTGKILFEKEPNTIKHPASTTKVMTCLLALENLDKDMVVTIDSEIPFTDGSRIYLLEGEQITVDQLLHAMMTESANDAAAALAKAVSGTIPEFAQLMNQRAKELGAKNTNFVNPHGLDNEAHTTTAYDLAMIARFAMTDPKISPAFRELVTTYKYYIPATNKQAERFLYNTNRLLYDTSNSVFVNGVKRTFKYDGVTGVKTGYTSKAGGSLIASAKRDGTELLAVSMRSTDSGRFADCMAMMDWGFANYKTVPKLKAGADLGKVKIKHGTVNRVLAVLDSDVAATLPLEASADVLSTKVVLKPSVKAPIEKGQVVGKVDIYEGETLLGSYDAVADKAVKEGGILSYVGIPDKTAKIMGIVLLVAILVLFILFAIYVFLKRRQVQRRKLRRQQRATKQREQEAARKAAWESEFDQRRQKR